MVVNSVNERGMTPLDVLTVFQSEAGDLEIYRTLVKAGAKSGKDIQNENEAGRIEQPLEVEIVHETHVPPRNCTDEKSNLPKRTFEELFAYKPNRDSTNDVRTILVTVAALMMTATYQAVLSPPGGVWTEDTHQYSAGKSIVATKSKTTFLLFILGNSIGYFTSFHMIIWLTSGFPGQYLLILLSFFMSFNYSASMLNLVPSDDRISYMLALLD
ncbi:uncharacterized protein LOC124841290 [Vigna umbellata]|uniref:uncharacterized protein LOC124841290 n=1 Tax=Vigna umbellata TaxID=87088 RepID=UPI001F5F617A|nr:uncharacterized protein LOC124841290 [Vigna umbellata]